MKVKIKSKGFPTTDYGFLEANKEYDLTTHFAAYCVNKMKSAEYVAKKQTRTRKKAE